MKLRIVFSGLLPLLVAVLADAQLSSPKIGVARYLDNSLHVVLGLSGNFVVSRDAIGSADAASFSNSGGLIAKNGRIELLGPELRVIASQDSGDSAPLLNMDGGPSSAIAWLPGEHALLHWNGKSFVMIAVNSHLLARVTSVRVVDSKTARLLVAENGGTVAAAMVSLENGNLLSYTLLPGVRAPAYEQHSFVLFSDEQGLEVLSPNGMVQTFSVRASRLSFERLSSDWLHVTSASTKQNWILHLANSAAELAELPGIAEAQN